MGELHRLGVIRRDDHPHSDSRLVEQFFGKAKRHPHAAVRGRIAGQGPAVQRDAVPGDALHVRHRGIVIHVRVVILFLVDDRKDAGRRLASRGAGRHRRAQDPALGVVQRDVLGLDRHDGHDRLAGIARGGRLLDGRGARLFRRGVGGQRRQGGHRRERHNGRRNPTPRRHGGSRRPGSICHVMPWSKCLSVLRRFIHDSPRRRKRGFDLAQRRWLRPTGSPSRSRLARRGAEATPPATPARRHRPSRYRPACPPACGPCCSRCASVASSLAGTRASVRAIVLGPQHHHAVLDLAIAAIDHGKALDLALAVGLGDELRHLAACCGRPRPARWCPASAPLAAAAATAPAHDAW